MKTKKIVEWCLEVETRVFTLLFGLIIVWIFELPAGTAVQQDSCINENEVIARKKTSIHFFGVSRNAAPLDKNVILILEKCNSLFLAFYMEAQVGSKMIYVINDMHNWDFFHLTFLFKS